MVCAVHQVNEIDTHVTHPKKIQNAEVVAQLDSECNTAVPKYKKG
jgi:hypothetical protein